MRAGWAAMGLGVRDEGVEVLQLDEALELGGHVSAV
jgi:hypothetical protein